MSSLAGVAGLAVLAWLSAAEPHVRRKSREEQLEKERAAQQESRIRDAMAVLRTRAIEAASRRGRVVTTSHQTSQFLSLVQAALAELRMERPDAERELDAIGRAV